MDKEDKRAAATALLDWFESQNISMPDACTIMGDVIGGFIGYVTSDKTDLDEGVDAFAHGMREMATLSQRLKK